jgi:hypothetical protein
MNASPREPQSSTIAVLLGPVRSQLAFVAVGAILLGGCGGSTEPAPGPTPPQFAFDAATEAAAKDPKFAAFTALVDARAKADAALFEFSAKHPLPRSEADEAQWQKLKIALEEATTATKQAMNDPAWTDDDKKVVRYLFATRAGRPASTKE